MDRHAMAVANAVRNSVAFVAVAPIASAYWIDWKDQQVSVLLTPGAVFDTHGEIAPLRLRGRTERPSGQDAEPVCRGGVQQYQVPGF